MTDSIIVTRSALYRWSVVGLLTAIYACAFIDRQILNLLAPAIQKDFVLSDVQTGLLLGPSFALVFVVAGLYFGRLADRADRSRLIRWGLAGWSVCTAACGIAPSFPFLFMARMGIGVGEATIAPAGVSLIGDTIAPPHRARALAIFNLGSNLGTASSYLLGAALIPTLPVILPLLGLMQPWQATFIYVGLPGLVLAGVALLVREPARRELMPSSSALTHGFLRARARLFIPFFGGATMLIMIGYGSAAWSPSFFGRVHHWSTTQIGIALGIMTFVSSISATVTTSWLVGWFRRRGHVDATLRAMMVGASLIIVPSILSWQLANPGATMVLYGCQVFSMAFALNLVGAAICDVAPNEWRASLFAIYLLVSSLAGLGLGPPLIGFFAQYLYHGDLRAAMSTFAALVAPGGILMLLASARAFRSAATEAASWR